MDLFEKVSEDIKNAISRHLHPREYHLHPEKYLPKQMSSEELEAELKKIISEVGATSPKDMGKVMGVASKALAGKAEGRAISETVKKLLA